MWDWIKRRRRKLMIGAAFLAACAVMIACLAPPVLPFFAGLGIFGFVTSVAGQVAIVGCVTFLAGLLAQCSLDGIIQGFARMVSSVRSWFSPREEYEYLENDPQQATVELEQEGHFSKHWGKWLLGIGVVIGIVSAALLTPYIAPLFPVIAAAAPILQVVIVGLSASVVAWVGGLSLMGIGQGAKAFIETICCCGIKHNTDNYKPDSAPGFDTPNRKILPIRIDLASEEQHKRNEDNEDVTSSMSPSN